MHFSSDADKGICQGAGAALLMRLRGLIVVEHSFNVEAQQETQKTARLTLLMIRDTCQLEKHGKKGKYYCSDQFK